jgi:hypothetical protein
MTVRGTPRLRETPNNPHKVPPRETTAISHPSQEAGSSPGETSSSSSGTDEGSVGRLSGSEGSETGCSLRGEAAGAGPASAGRSRAPEWRLGRSGWANSFLDDEARVFSDDEARAGAMQAARKPNAVRVEASIDLKPGRGPFGRMGIDPPFANVGAVTGYKQRPGRRFAGIPAEFRRSVRICFCGSVY